MIKRETTRKVNNLITGRVREGHRYEKARVRKFGETIRGHTSETETDG